MVGAGAVARKWLREQHGVGFRGCMTHLGEIAIPFEGWEHVPNNPFFAANASLVPELEAAMDALRKEGDSVGARILVEATGVPPGLGEPLADKLDADIAYAMMGINAVKGVEIGAGLAAWRSAAASTATSSTPDGFRSNNAGGVLGGISTGQDIAVAIAIADEFDPAPRASIDRSGAPTVVQTFRPPRPCVGIRATPIAGPCWRSC